MGICKICGKEFEDSKYRKNVFCSLNCYRVEQRKGSYKRGTSRKYLCSNCGKEVLGRAKTKNRKGERVEDIFCDRKCYDNYRAKKILASERECDHCGKNYIPLHVAMKYKRGFCSEACRIENGFNHVKNKHGVKGITEDGKYIKECKICEIDFFVDKRKANHSVCSKECISIMYKTDSARKEKISKAFQGVNHPNYVNGCSYNYRVRKTEFREYFSKDDKKNAFKLFGNKCFKCGTIEDLTLDHHVPFSKGGRLSLSNTVVLCRSCNSKKNAQMPRQFYTKEEILELSKKGIDDNSLFNFLV